MIAELTDWLLFLHILAAIVWLGGLVTLSLLATLVLRSRDGESVRRFVGSLRVLARLRLPGSCSALRSSPERFSSEPCSRATPRSAPSARPTQATTARPRASCAAGQGAHD